MTRSIEINILKPISFSITKIHDALILSVGEQSYWVFSELSQRHQIHDTLNRYYMYHSNLIVKSENPWRAL